MAVARPRVVVVGAGFGGLSAARGLAGVAVDVVLIDRVNHHLFQPLLYQVATAALAPSDIASPTRYIFSRQRNAEVLLGEVESADPTTREVRVRNIGAIRYDYLILATGSTSSWFGHAEWAEHTTGLKSLADAEMLRERLLGAFECAESRTDPAEIHRLLTFVVVGAGPSGVELAGAIRELAHSTLARDFRHINAASARVLLLEGGPTVLSGFAERLGRYAHAKLERLGVEVRTGTQVEQVDAEGVTAGGQRIEAANVFWCAGVAPTPAAHWLGVAPARRGAVPVEPDCSVAGHPEVFAIGDIAHAAGKGGKPLPGVAPVAKQQGKYVARVIARRVAGKPLPPPFAYRDAGSLAIIGRSAAVADLPGLKLTGFLAWLLWGGVHLYGLVGARNRILVYIQWIWAWVTYGSGARLITGADGAAYATTRPQGSLPSPPPTGDDRRAFTDPKASP